MNSWNILGSGWLSLKTLRYHQLCSKEAWIQKDQFIGPLSIILYTSTPDHDYGKKPSQSELFPWKNIKNM